MKPFCFFLIFFSTAYTLQAQVGIGTTTPDQSAQLEIQSISKGLLVPRVNSTSNVSNPAKGLLVFQTLGTEGFYYNSGTPTVPAWLRLITTTTPSGTAGGDLTGTYPNPTITTGAITLNKINVGGASAGQVPTFNGSSVVWATPSGNTLSYSHATITGVSNVNVFHESVNVPFPDSHLQDGIAIDGSNAYFTVSRPGIYRIAYTVTPNPNYFNGTTYQTILIGSRIAINGAAIIEGSYPQASLKPEYNKEVLVSLGAGAYINYQLFGNISLLSLQSASLIIQQIR